MWDKGRAGTTSEESLAVPGKSPLVVERGPVATLPPSIAGAVDVRHRCAVHREHLLAESHRRLVIALNLAEWAGLDHPHLAGDEQCRTFGTTEVRGVNLHEGDRKKRIRRRDDGQTEHHRASFRLVGFRDFCFQNAGYLKLGCFEGNSIDFPA
ncbi:MAG: hypothetical protein A3B10_01955 [Candidatus Doudnabacteria bacterium RIFCSPLOWO2_01_FULL_44_21]|uniref:Uncharacterized protein n=1 Tax=Candidatus Doudnabacteria bacterium RIFCSPLOWO2_01_FULL_44_21 TaxID=1817841 RepID=A0A1F5Q2S6_9BACT|nr:MAG: hypothetical protein A3B95_01845 [Candidatus Doudnabacteria bacterium RIFCSPHIGHO2_02_FULL_43_13b]OGE96428.1 MAG: hypothetical protein A3B10_01955 [Candidatus Doudnabacteria bacterium RIFCSPLOWO2_01_FULL_44_21]